MPGMTGAIDAITSLFGLGQAKPAPVAPGAAEIARLQSATKPDGSPAFSSQDIAKYQRDTSLTLMHAGFTVQQIEAHWGMQPPNSPQVAAHVANNIQKSGVTESHGYMAAFEAGWGTSVAGISEHMATGQDPNKAFQIKPDPGLLHGIAQAAGQTVGDIGTDLLGFFGGATAGAAVPGAGETGLSEAVGAVAGAAGMGIASQGTREALLDAYNRNQIHGFSDFMHVVGASTIRTLKAGVSSAPFGLAGPIAGRVAEAGAGRAVAAVAGIGGATAAGVATGAALNGRMPDAKDFVTAAATMLVMHGAIKAGAVVNGVFRPSPATLHIQSNLEEIYRRNGTTPWDAINAAKGDPGLRQEILQQDVSGNSVAPRTHANAPQEPPPIKPAAEAAPEPPAPREKPKPILTFVDGFLQDSAGGPRKFATQREAAKYLSSIGEGDLEIANHPDGSGFGIRGNEIAIKAWREQRRAERAAAREKAASAGPDVLGTPKPAPIVNTFEELSTALEGSRDDSVSPAGAIGKHQIMIGTARQYGFGNGMSQADLAQWLHDPANNGAVFHKIAADLHARFHGDMNAMLIAYNAGPGRAGEYMSKGPGTELEAIPDPKARGGVRYESRPSARDESFLPMETQKYLANGRRRSGGATEEAAGVEGGGTKDTAVLKVFPSEDNHAMDDSAMDCQ